MSIPPTIRPKEKAAILQSLRAGVVPRSGLQHIQVGRAREVQALLDDVERIQNGASSVRFIIGVYGAGKTFFMHLVRAIAHEKGLLTVHADLTPDRRLHATGGQARSLYMELMRNLASRTKPEGGALPSVVERFVTSAMTEAKESGKKVDDVILQKLQRLSEMVGGYDFAEVIASYWKGHDTGNEQLKLDAIRWLRGEFSTKTDARSALGIRTIIDDSNVYDHLKILSLFSTLSGYSGILVGLDELVNLYKLANAQARNANYEQILMILNDCLQGVSTNLGFVMCGTPDFLMDTRRGLYSYPALQSRLAENTFAKAAGVADFSGPVVRLSSLSPEDLFVLLGKIRHVYASGDPAKYLVPDDALRAFMNHCSQRIGDSYFRTPRTTIKSFADLLSLLEQNPGLEWTALLGDIKVEADISPDASSQLLEENQATSVEGQPSITSKPQKEDDLTSFKL